MIERSLIFIKPDGVQRGLVGEILSRFERCGLKIIGLKMVYASKEMAGNHYTDDDEWLVSVGNKTIESYKSKGVILKETPRSVGQRIRNQLMDFISMSPSVAVCIEGHEAVAKVRTIVGPTAPAQSPPGTIRGDFSIDSYRLADVSNRPIQNLIHASGTVGEAAREIAVWFTEGELHPYKRVDEDLIYRKVEE